MNIKKELMDKLLLEVMIKKIDVRDTIKKAFELGEKYAAETMGIGYNREDLS